MNDVNFYLVLTNIVIILIFINKKKIKNIFHFNYIDTCDPSEIDDAFIPIERKNGPDSPRKEIIVKSFFVPSNFNVEGMTNDYEAWILSVVSAKKKNIFEFGTCSGKTTYLFALNSSPTANIYTITLDPSILNAKRLKNTGSSKAQKYAIQESQYTEYMFSNTVEEKKIELILSDSRDLSIERFKKKMDLIFIDGGHTYELIKNDSELAFQMISKNGIIFWHDYDPRKKSKRDVCKYINKISKEKKIKRIKNTSLCFYKEI
jgi:predicted O-methyltransferase YrrM